MRVKNGFTIICILWRWIRIFVYNKFIFSFYIRCDKIQWVYFQRSGYFLNRQNSTGVTTFLTENPQSTKDVLVRLPYVLKKLEVRRRSNQSDRYAFLGKNGFPPGHHEERSKVQLTIVLQILTDSSLVRRFNLSKWVIILMSSRLRNMFTRIAVDEGFKGFAEVQGWS